MVLAAGRGERMRPLTDNCPKPLLEVGGKPLMQYHLESFVRNGFRELVVNTAWLGHQIESRFAPESAWGAQAAAAGFQPARIRYSNEGKDFGGALETAGGIARALPLLAETFWLVGGDVYVPGFDFSRAAMDRFEGSGKLAHLFLVPNPQHNPKGDFGLQADGLALNHADTRYTYSTIGMYRQGLFATLPHGNPQGVKAPLAPLLRAAMDNGLVSAEIYTGAWTDVGTPERLAQLNAS
ncbi:MAG: nucleotidyltransferase-like protein [Ramlibacter sp.]|nr:nucleotidyltransferase-like protein [Ramlibacter sp.]